MLIFGKDLQIVFFEGLIRKTGIIKSLLAAVDRNSRYLVDVYERGELSNKSCSVLESQILQVLIKDTYGFDVWVRLDDLYASYPNNTIIKPNTKYELLCSVIKRNSERYHFSKDNSIYAYANEYLANDEKAVKTAMWEWKITPKKVIFNGPATIVIWQDGTKTIVKKSEDDTDDREKAVMYAILKKLCGNKAGMDRYLKQFFKEVESNEEKKEEAGSSELHWEK